LIDDGIDGERGLAGLAVADDEFALAAADRHHRVDGLETGLHRLAHRLARDHARRDLFDRARELGGDRAAAVDRLAERVDHAPDQFRADRHFQDAAGAFHGVALGDVLVLAQDHGTDRVALEVEREPEGVARELEHFALHGIGQAVHAADAVGETDHRALITGLGLRRELLDARTDEFAYFGWIELHRRSSVYCGDMKQPERAGPAEGSGVRERGRRAAAINKIVRISLLTRHARPITQILSVTGFISFVQM